MTWFWLCRCCCWSHRATATTCRRTSAPILPRLNRLQQDALFDAVTGLRNHRYFQVRLREELQRSDRAGAPIALVVMDLDNFKRVNDQFGHARGDEVLRRVAETL